MDRKKIWIFGRLLKLVLLVLGIGILTSCGGAFDDDKPKNTAAKEISFCSTVRSFTSPNTITGTATYTPRVLTGTPGTGGLGAAGTARPIRGAEIRVTDPSNVEVQCGETDINDGTFSVNLPNDGATYTVTINARGFSSNVKVSVLDAPSTNYPWGISTTVVSDGSKAIPGSELEAGVSGDVLAGAFNIFDLILMANEYLRLEVGSCSTLIQNCADFTAAPKVSVYWKQGLNPGGYFGIGPVSFYLPGYRELYILGGYNGNTNEQDTDHFDNSIILHEYGHFLEDVYSNTDSPGGSHSGNRQIDPRLAMGEGWGNFFQAAVRDKYSTELGITADVAKRYIDTRGDESGSTSYIFYIDLEEADASCAGVPATPGCDVPGQAGAGNFREFSVARLFWDVIDGNNDLSGSADTFVDGFEHIWAAITDGNGYLSSSVEFRSVGLVHEIQKGLLDGGGSATTDWAPLLSNAQHLHQDDRQEYAQYVLADDSCSPGPMPYSITPLDDVAGDTDDDITNYPANLEWQGRDLSYFSSSNNPGTVHLLRNNDFFQYYHAGGTLEITLNYETQPGGGEADLDLFVYDSLGNYGSQSSIQGVSWDDPATLGVLDTESEAVSISGLPAGNYLINVKVAPSPQPTPTLVGGPTLYELKITGGNRICPASLP